MSKQFSFRCRECNLYFRIELQKVLYNNSNKFPEVKDIEFCPVCGMNDLARNYKDEQKSVHYKGTGFYSTDAK